MVGRGVWQEGEKEVGRQGDSGWADWEFNEGRRAVISWVPLVAPKRWYRASLSPGALKFARAGALTPTNASTRHFSNSLEIRMVLQIDRGGFSSIMGWNCD
jgi:hypothetical protein